jgi:hypothetical protein
MGFSPPAAMSHNHDDAPPRHQFSVRDLMILMIGVALGLAGGSWMPTDVFAASLGLLTLVGLLIVSWHPPRTHLGKLLWATLVLAYVIAVFAAVFRPLAQPVRVGQAFLPAETLGAAFATLRGDRHLQ